MVNGDCKIGERVFVGSQSVLANGIEVGDDIIVGAGSLVRKSIKTPGSYSGNPLKLYKQLNINNVIGGGNFLISSRRYFNSTSLYSRVA